MAKKKPQIERICTISSDTVLNEIQRKINEIIDVINKIKENSLLNNL